MTKSSDGIELTQFSKPQLLMTESAQDFAALNAALMEEIKPRGIIERLYVADIAALVWDCKTAPMQGCHRQHRLQGRAVRYGLSSRRRA